MRQYMSSESSAKDQKKELPDQEPERLIEDFIFRYSLSPEDLQPRHILYEDKIIELFRQQVINLLDVIELTNYGEPLKIDGFAFLSDPQKIYKLFGSEQG